MSTWKLIDRSEGFFTTALMHPKAGDERIKLTYIAWLLMSTFERPDLRPSFFLCFFWVCKLVLCLVSKRGMLSRFLKCRYSYPGKLIRSSVLVVFTALESPGSLASLALIGVCPGPNICNLPLSPCFSDCPSIWLDCAALWNPSCGDTLADMMRTSISECLWRSYDYNSLICRIFPNCLTDIGLKIIHTPSLRMTRNE